MRSNALLILNPLSPINEQSLANHRALGNKRGIAHSLSQLAQVFFLWQQVNARTEELSQLNHQNAEFHGLPEQAGTCPAGAQQANGVQYHL